MEIEKKSYGVAIECLMSYSVIGVIAIPSIITQLLDNKFVFKDAIFSEDFSKIDLNTLISNPSEIFKNGTSGSIIINFRDTKSEIDLSILFDLKNNVIVLSIPEKQIMSDIKKFSHFGNICKIICDLHPPQYAIIGEESFLPADVTVDKLQQNRSVSPYNSDFFSEQNFKKTFNQWYQKNKANT